MLLFWGKMCVHKDIQIYGICNKNKVQLPLTGGGTLSISQKYGKAVTKKNMSGTSWGALSYRKNMLKGGLPTPSSRFLLLR